MRPYFGENTKDGKFPHLLIQLNKALDVQVRSAATIWASGTTTLFVLLAAATGTRVVSTSFFCPNASRASFQRFGFLGIVHGSHAVYIVFLACRHVGMVWAQSVFVDRQRPLVKGLSLFVLALGVVKRRQIVEGLSHVFVLGAKVVSRIANARSNSGSAFVYWPWL
jgi:hypothetical protein